VKLSVETEPLQAARSQNVIFGLCGQARGAPELLIERLPKKVEIASKLMHD
jgi:hypothetical protein